MTPEQRKEIEERVAAAQAHEKFAAKWEAVPHNPDNPKGEWTVQMVCPKDRKCERFSCDCFDPLDCIFEDEARAIAATHNQCPALLSALDAAEARAKAAEKRVEELEAALECSYTLACRGVERIDEENKTAGPRLSLAHRRRLAIMCNQIRKHKDKWLRAEEKDNAVEVGG